MAILKISVLKNTTVNLIGRYAHTGITDPHIVESFEAVEFQEFCVLLNEPISEVSIQLKKNTIIPP